jgi:hypothetical protein
VLLGLRVVEIEPLLEHQNLGLHHYQLGRRPAVVVAIDGVDRIGQQFTVDCGVELVEKAWVRLPPNWPTTASAKESSADLRCRM